MHSAQGCQVQGAACERHGDRLPPCRLRAEARLTRTGCWEPTSIRPPSPPSRPRAHIPRLSATLSPCAGAWYFYPYGLQTFYPAVVSWWAARGSGRQHVWESRDSSPHFQVRHFGSGRRSLPQPVFAVSSSTRTPVTHSQRGAVLAGTPPHLPLSVIWRVRIWGQFA